MDWYKLQHKLYNLDPADYREDFARLQQSAKKPVEDITIIDHINESVEVQKETMLPNLNSINDLAILAGMQPKQTINEDNKKPGPGRFDGFAAGWQTGKKLAAPDSAERFVKDKFGQIVDPGKQYDNTDTVKNKPTVKVPQGLVPSNRQQDLKDAITLINQGQTVTNPKQHQALAAAFRTLLDNPQTSSRLLSKLKDSIDHDTIKTPIEPVVKKEYRSFKEELYKLLAAKK